MDNLTSSPPLRGSLTLHYLAPGSVPGIVPDEWSGLQSPITLAAQLLHTPSKRRVAPRRTRSFLPPPSPPKAPLRGAQPPNAQTGRQAGLERQARMPMSTRGHRR